MSTRLIDGVIRLEGRCRIEEAETLLALLIEDGTRPVNLSRCGAMHTAIVQILLAVKPVISDMPDDPFICTRILPLLQTNGLSSEPARP